MTINRQTSYHTLRIVLALMLGVFLIAAEAAAQLYFRATDRLQSLTKPRRSSPSSPPSPQRVPGSSFAQQL